MQLPGWSGIYFCEVTTINKFIKNHVYFFSIALVFIAMGLLYFCSLFLFRPDNPRDYGIEQVLSYLIPIVFTFTILLLLKGIKEVGFRKSNIWKGLYLGWFFLAAGVILFVSSYIGVDKTTLSSPSFGKLLAFTCVVFFVGVFEEVLCRGIILNTMINQWGHTKNGIIKSIIFSSLLFGLAHLINLIANPILIIATFSQIVYAFLHGILYASVYVRCRNLWAVIILHAVYDWLALGLYIFTPVQDVIVSKDTSIESALMNILLSIPYALIGLYLVRKKKVKDSRSL